ncbi:MAG: hypothetical protein GWN73_36050, partial [Actinobacteria bacterium]|nr:hypothetical protein [Actinomycetota bacterium]NIU70493.1 hypothetical protein [Actinomycetota bacterium]NIW32389.1 hypothetical protein [Actinomycetota bacterium]
AAAVAGWAPLQGGISSTMTRIDLEGGRAVVVREPWEGHRDPAAQLGTEYELLEHIAAEGIPAPAPLLVDDG